MKLPPDYELREKIDEDELGERHLAFQRSMDRKVAFKILKETLAQQPGKAEEFLRRCSVLSQLSHPNLATVFDAGNFEGTCYMTMEAPQGQSLARKAPLGVAAACEITIAVARALKAAEEVGIRHGRLDPSKVYVHKSVGVKVTEIGLAGLAPPPQNPYQAPEAEASGPTAAADIYSLGAMLHHLVTGRAPGVVLGREVPTAVYLLLKRMLSQNPSERPQSYDEVIAELDKAAQVRDAPRKAAAPKQAPSPVVFFIPTVVVLVLGIGGTLIVRNMKGAAKPVPPEVAALLDQYDEYRQAGKQEEAMAVLTKIVETGKEPYASQAISARRAIREQLEGSERRRRQIAADAFEKLKEECRLSEDTEGKVTWWENYIRKYPDTPYADEARKEIERLKSQRASTQAGLEKAVADARDSVQADNFREAIDTLEAFIAMDGSTLWAEKARAEISNVEKQQAERFEVLFARAKGFLAEGKLSAARPVLDTLMSNFTPKYADQARTELARYTARQNEEERKLVSARLAKGREYLDACQYSSAYNELMVTTTLLDLAQQVSAEQQRMLWEERIYGKMAERLKAGSLKGAELGLDVAEVKAVQPDGLLCDGGKVIKWRDLPGNAVLKLGQQVIDPRVAQDYLDLSSFCLRFGHVDSAAIALKYVQELSPEALKVAAWYPPLVKKAGGN